jgi:hypothetical protein
VPKKSGNPGEREKKSRLVGKYFFFAGKSQIFVAIRKTAEHDTLMNPWVTISKPHMT